MLWLASLRIPRSSFDLILLLHTTNSRACIQPSFLSKVAMSAARLHPSLPAPVVHSGFSVSQSKSHVLAGVQDAYWSDDEGVSYPPCFLYEYIVTRTNRPG